MEQPVAAPDARLAEQHRPAAVELDRQRSDEQDRRKQHQCAPRDRQVEGALEQAAARVERPQRHDRAGHVGKVREADGRQALPFGQQHFALDVGTAKQSRPGLAPVRRAGDDDALGVGGSFAEGRQDMVGQRGRRDVDAGHVDRRQPRDRWIVQRGGLDAVDDDHGGDMPAAGMRFGEFVQGPAARHHQRGGDHDPGQQQAERHVDFGMQVGHEQQRRSRRGQQRRHRIARRPPPILEEPAAVRLPLQHDAEIDRQQHGEIVDHPDVERVVQRDRAGQGEGREQRGEIERDQRRIDAEAKSASGDRAAGRFGPHRSGLGHSAAAGSSVRGETGGRPAPCAATASVIAAIIISICRSRASVPLK